MYICAARDAVAEAYGTPFFVSAVGLAIRSFVDEVRREDSQSAIAAHPSDFCLYVLGTFDPATGVLVPLDVPELLISGDAAKVASQS